MASIGVLPLGDNIRALRVLVCGSINILRRLRRLFIHQVRS